MATDSKNLKLCRVTSAVKTAFDASTPASGSVYWDETENSLRVGDGSTKGGIAIPSDVAVTATGSDESRSMSDWCAEVAKNAKSRAFNIFPSDDTQYVLTSDQRGTGSGSRAAVQGCAYDKNNNVLYMLHHITQNNVETSLISRHTIINGESTTIDQSAVLTGTVGHQGIAVEPQSDGTVKLWSSHAYEQAGGVALRFTYNANADISDVQEYILHTSTGSFSLDPAISPDGKYLCVVVPGPKIRVFDLATLVAGGAGNYATSYIREFDISSLRKDGGSGTQAIACDGEYIYTMGSITDITAPHCLRCYSMTGELIAENLDVYIGVNDVAEGKDYCESECLTVMPMNGMLTLMDGVCVASSTAEDNTSKRFNLYPVDSKLPYCDFGIGIVANSPFLPVSGDGSISGGIVEKAYTPYLFLDSTPLVSGTKPETGKYGFVRFRDSSENILGQISHYVSTGGVSQTVMTATQFIQTDPVNVSVMCAVDYTAATKVFRPDSKNDISLGSSGYPWSAIYAASSSITTSDERLKQDINAIPDEVLDAWGDVGWSQFRFCDSVAYKGDAARIHSGLIAQRIDEVFKNRGLDATRYGLLCYDKWDSEEPSYDEDGTLMSKGVEAGDKWSVRYEEALAMEAAYQRRRADRIEARLTALERKLVDDGSSSAEEVANADYND